MTPESPQDPTHQHARHQESSQQHPKPNKAQHPLEMLVLAAFILTWIYTKDAIMATLVLTAGSAIQLVILLAMKTPLTKMQKAMFAAIFIGGGLTIAFQDPQFLKWKLTIVNAIFAGILLVMHFLGKHPIKSLMEGMTKGQEMEIKMPDSAWNSLTYIFIGFFGVIAAINAYITLYMDFNAWVYFKSILFVVSLLFFPIVLMVFLVKHKAFAEAEAESKNTTPSDESQFK